MTDSTVTVRADDLRSALAVFDRLLDTVAPDTDLDDEVASSLDVAAVQRLRTAVRRTVQ